MTVSGPPQQSPPVPDIDPTRIIGGANQVVTPAGWKIKDGTGGNTGDLVVQFTGNNNTLLFPQPSNTGSYVDILNNTNGDGLYAQNVVGFTGNAANLVIAGGGHALAGDAVSGASNDWGNITAHENVRLLTLAAQKTGYTTQILQLYSDHNNTGIALYGNVGVGPTTAPTFIEFDLNSVAAWILNNTGQVTTYASIATVLGGHPAAYAGVTTGVLLQTTATAITSYTPAASGNFMVAYCFTHVTGTVAGTIVVTYTDLNTNATATQTVVIASGAPGVAQSGTLFVTAKVGVAIAVTGTAATNNDGYGTAEIFAC